uniref:Synaptotagmin-like protein 1 n=1 Tax=Monopterus albus TaxID=43700 RepID=A0A3Q3K692_MONAL
MEVVQVDSSLDLSQLTEDEQSTILNVLQRDLDLRQRDEGRVRILEQTETDPVRLRWLSGAWFSEECNKRRSNWKSGSDLVRATIRHRKSKSRGQFSFYALLPLPTFGAAERGNLPQQHHLSGSGQKTEGQQGRGECKVSEGREKSYDMLHDSCETVFPLSCFRGQGSLNPAPISRCSLSGSMMSLFSSGEFGVVEVTGRIQFSLVYDTQKEELQVKVQIMCVHVFYRYVKAYLLPDKSSQSKKKTSVKKKTLNPVYDQTLRYKVRIGELRSRTLNLSVWHAEPLGRNMFLGEVEVALGSWDWTSTQPLWQDLQPRVHLNPESISSRGTIMLSIKFVPEGFEGGGMPLTGELHIWLREAQGLLANKGGAIDSFVRSYILPDASQQSGQKTRVVKHSISPIYNHTMVYDGFHTSDLREACAELTVWHREGLKTHALGGIRLSCGTGLSYGEAASWMDSTEEEVAVWTSMIETPNQWIDTSLPIRTNLTDRSK